jgi:hypothetical protein
MNSEYVRSGIQVLGYVLEGETGMVREVRYVRICRLVVRSPVLLLTWRGVEKLSCGYDTRADKR